MKEVFIPKNFNPKHRQLLDTADRIMKRYASQGYDLSLRQLYYQFVAHHGLPNSDQNYKLLGGVISDGRLAGELDWDTLVDRGRSTTTNLHFEDPADRIEHAARNYMIDLWEDQPVHVEVMVEKQALEGVLEPVCRRLDIPFTANKGYSSSSAMYQVGGRLEEILDRGRGVVIIYLGDHDPSGIDMTRDVEDRLALFSRAGYWDEDEKKVLKYEDFEDRFTVVRAAFEHGSDPTIQSASEPCQAHGLKGRGLYQGARPGVLGARRARSRDARPASEGSRRRLCRRGSYDGQTRATRRRTRGPQAHGRKVSRGN